MLDECRRYWELTGGAFDPTVQALWTLYWEHFSRPRHDPAGPSADALRTALDKVGFRHVAFDRSRIVLGRRGMGLTLNGIAQGYATDRVVALLRAEGIERSLVDMGESRALGSPPRRRAVAHRHRRSGRTRAGERDPGARRQRRRDIRRLWLPIRP